MNISPLELMKKISELEKNAGELTKRAEGIIVEGESGAGMVKVTLSATGTVKDIFIADEVYSLDSKEALITLLKSAFNNATEKKNGEMQALVTQMAGGLR